MPTNHARRLAALIVASVPGSAAVARADDAPPASGTWK
jgi:hypothetical protein